MRKPVISIIAVIFALLLAWSIDIPDSVGAEVPRMAKSELKAQLGQSDLIILDVRRDSDWNSSGDKIQGAVRENPGDFKRWADKYPKEKTIVLYCA